MVEKVRSLFVINLLCFVLSHSEFASHTNISTNLGGFSQLLMSDDVEISLGYIEVFARR